MLHFQQLAATHEYRYPAEQAEREQKARVAALVAESRRTGPAIAPRRTQLRSFVPRIAGALGLF